MRRLIYLCPEASVPIGGVKVIYRHVAALNQLGVQAFVLHPNDPAFRYAWSEHSVRFRDNATLNRFADFVVVPEIYTLSFGLQCRSHGCPYALFVQNGYILHPLTDDDAEIMRDVVHGADLVLSISADTDRMLLLNFPRLDPARLFRVQYAVPDCFVTRQDSVKTQDGIRTITYMPRKLPVHVRQVLFALQQYLSPGWRTEAIDQVDEATCAAMLRQSTMFLSFSEFEGFALPPLEAALAGNLVIGYTGQGGMEYWVQPNFQPIAQGDIFGFVEAARLATRQIDAGQFGAAVLAPRIAELALRFSPAAEIGCLKRLVERVAAISPAGPVQPR